MLTLILVTVTMLFLAAAASADGGYQQAIDQMIGRVFPDDPARARCIADHESDGIPGHYNPRALNGSNTGLFQIDRRTWDWRLNPAAVPIVGRLDWSRMLEPGYNARAARLIFLRYGWTPWTTRSLCGA